MKSFRVIIAGGRDYTNYTALKENVIQDLKVLREKINHSQAMKCKELTIISGHARGADTLGEQFAKEFHLPLVLFPADWDKNGKSAGYARNVDMAKFAIEDPNSQGILIAFWDGKSKGTEHMIETAKKRGLEIVVHRY